MDTLIFNLKDSVEQGDKKETKQAKLYFCYTKMRMQECTLHVTRNEEQKISTFNDKIKNVHIKIWYCNIHCAS